ncbi:hypothetical protein [Natribacillus halophilus]|uniref:Uncharacterized protein n=1 Tax=Natribacillus halophilus TaxID=549003 RepID=A0A1G8NIQ5_9BACI|nr:hypothetical protein [Natribacillus halophilus]SDI79926.1 hypothetical protein SAMN04488123_10697 [Natribacillus halophilus]
MDWFMTWIFPPIVLAIIVFYFVALGKNVRRTEDKHGRDMTHELNPFTGTKMPSADDDDKDRKKNKDKKTTNISPRSRF